MPEEKVASQTQPVLRLKQKERFVTLLEYVRWEAKRDEKYVSTSSSDRIPAK
ncbi:MAG: hypothetical protein SH848_18945 [Saprospiraceae bacterium]|nr:hypothetical protein [Saprospiraceae bacterium]